MRTNASQQQCSLLRTVMPASSKRRQVTPPPPADAPGRRVAVTGERMSKHSSAPSSPPAASRPLAGETRATFKPGDSDGSGAKNRPVSRLSLRAAAESVTERSKPSRVATHRYTSLDEPTAMTSALGAWYVTERGILGSRMDR